VTDNVYCLVKIIEKDERIIAAAQFEIELFDFFFYQSKQLTDYIYMDVYCKLSKCIGQTPCSYEHYLVTKCSHFNTAPHYGIAHPLDHQFHTGSKLKSKKVTKNQNDVDNTTQRINACTNCNLV